MRDSTIDVDYLLSIIIHELRHVYDIINISGEYEMKDFIKSIWLPKFRGSGFDNFINLVYLSLEHELIARHNMLYPMLRWIDITDKHQLYDIFKKTYVYESLIMLSNFDSTYFVDSFDEQKLKEFTTNFIEKVDEGNFCENKQDLIRYYNKWENFFKEKSTEFLSYVDTILDEIVNDITYGIPHDEKVGFSSYSEHIGSGVRKMFKEFYEKIFNENEKDMGISRTDQST